MPGRGSTLRVRRELPSRDSQDSSISRRLNLHRSPGPMSRCLRPQPPHRSSTGSRRRVLAFELRPGQLRRLRCERPAVLEHWMIVAFSVHIICRRGSMSEGLLTAWAVAAHRRPHPRSIPAGRRVTGGCATPLTRRTRAMPPPCSACSSRMSCRPSMTATRTGCRAPGSLASAPRCARWLPRFAPGGCSTTTCGGCTRRRQPAIEPSAVGRPDRVTQPPRCSPCGGRSRTRSRA